MLDVHRTIIVQFSDSFLKASLATNVVKNFVANDDSRGPRRALRSSLVGTPQWSPQLDIRRIGCVLLKHIGNAVLKKL